MSCFCEEAYEIPECTSTIEIGTLTPSTTYWIKVKNTVTGYIDTQEATSDIVGVLVLDSTIPSKEFYNSNGLYQLSVSLPNSVITLPITIGLTTFDCVYLTFFKSKGEQLTNAVIKLIV